MTDDEALQKLYAFCLRKLTVRDYAEGELRKLLKRREATPEQSDALLTRLRELGYLNEARIARGISNQAQRRGKGPQYLRMQLSKKGISMTPAQARALFNSDDPEEELRQAHTVLERLRAREPETKPQALGLKLGRRGFSFETIQRLLRGETPPELELEVD